MRMGRRLAWSGALLLALVAAAAWAQGASKKGARGSSKTTPLTGKFFGYEGKTLHTWEFNADGSFLHTVVAEGSGSEKHSENGQFILSGDSLALTVESEAGVHSGAESTPSAGLVMGGGPGPKGKKRKVLMTFKLVGAQPADGIVIDGVALKPKTW
jgi:hypothetical protein